MKSPIKVLLVDDETLARANLRHALASHPRWQIVGECASVAAAREELARSGAQVLLLDIKMPRESGLALARGLAEFPTVPLVIFISAFDRFAIEAFELHALDYVLKPFDDERFRQALQRAEELIDLRQEAAYAAALRDYLGDLPAQGSPAALSRLTVRSAGRIESVAVAEIQYIVAAGNYARLHLVGRSLLHRSTLNLLESRLDKALFLRVHRSALVRRGECVSLSVVGDGVYRLHLRSGAQVQVSERYVDAVREVLAER